jgi:membrane protein
LTSVLTMATIDRVFNQIWRVKKSRPLLQRILVYWAIITLGPLLIGVSISVTSYLYSATNGVVTSVPFIGASFYTLISVLLTTSAFTLLYIAVPNQWVDWRDAVWGGLLAGVAVEIAKRLFASYVMKFPTYTMVYGAVAALPIFLLWIYMLWMITLVGALLTAALPIVRYERWWHVASPGSEFVDAMKVLKILHEARANGESATVDVAILRAHTHMGLEELQNLLQRMLDAGWVGSLKSEAPKKSAWNKRLVDGLDRWTLLINPEFLKLVDVYRLFVFDTAAHVDEDRSLVNRVDGAVAAVLDQTLESYFSEVHDGPDLREVSQVGMIAGR